MSVNYYVACKKCQKCYHVGQDGLSGFSFYSGEPRCMKGLWPFLSDHVLCGILIICSEYRVEEYEEVPWPNRTGYMGDINGIGCDPDAF